MINHTVELLVALKWNNCLDLEIVNANFRHCLEVSQDELLLGGFTMFRVIILDYFGLSCV